MAKREVRVAVTGAAGQIGYALLFRIANGDMFGPDTDVHLQLLELEPALPALQGVCLELDDCAFPRLASVKATSKLHEAFKDADWALLVGSVPRKAGMERADLLNINGKIFTEQGKAIKTHAKSTCRMLVVGNPCNTNAYIAYKAGGLNPKQVFAMTMLDQNRAVAQLAQKAHVRTQDVKNLAIWGNHSPTMFPDFAHATIAGKKCKDAIKDENWLKGDFLTTVQQRGAAIIKARGASSAASAANAVIDTVKRIVNPTAAGDCFSVAVPSDGSYGVDKDVVFSFPMRSDGQHWEIQQGVTFDDFAKQKFEATLKELREERDAVQNLL